MLSGTPGSWRVLRRHGPCGLPKFFRKYSTKLSIKDFYEIFWRRVGDKKLDVVCSAEMSFAASETGEVRAVKELIARHASAS